MADDTTTVTSDPTQVANDTSGEPADVSENAPADSRPSPGRRWVRWLVAGLLGSGVLLVVACLVIGYAVWRVGSAATARSESGERLTEACGQLEQRLNRLVPPGATRTPSERATTIEDENAAVAPLIAELRELPKQAHGYRSLSRDWEALLSARSRYADDLDRSHRTGRPAFFVMKRDKEGVDPVRRIIQQSPERCQGAVRRLAAPDL